MLADAATSVLAIVALVGGWIWGWSWLDPAMGIVGAMLVAHWARGLLKETGRALLDREMDHPVVDEIREVIDAHAQPGNTRLVDLHVWRVGPGQHAAIVSLVTHKPRPAAFYHARLQGVATLGHVSIEVQTCPN